MSINTFKLSEAYNWVRTVVPMKYRKKWMVFVVILCGVSLDNFSAVSTVITTDSIQSHFNTSYAIASWVVSGYALTLGSFIILFGKLADILGPDNVFILGMNIFWISSLITAAVDQSVIVVIIFRTFQGIGGAALVPASYALAGNYFYSNPKELQIALASVFLALTASMGSGAVIGGAFAESAIGYQGLFYFLFGCSFVIGVMSIFLIIPVPKTEEHKKMKVKNIDFVGMFLFIVGALLIILGLTEGGDSWKTPKAYVPLPVGFVLVVLSGVWELVYIRSFEKRYQLQAQNMESPSSSVDEVQVVEVNAEKDIETVVIKRDWRVSLDLMFPMEALKVHDYTLFAMGSTLYYVSFAFVISLSIEYHIYVSLDAPIIAACKILPYIVGLVLTGIFINEKEMLAIGTKVMLTASSAFSVGGYVILSREVYTIHNGYWKFGLPGIFLYGIGNSLYFKYFFVKIFPGIPVHLQGIASGIYQAFSQIAFSLGNALLASIVGKIFVANTPELKKEFSDRFVTVRYVGYGVVGTIFILTLFMGWDKAIPQSNDVEVIPVLPEVLPHIEHHDSDETIESAKQDSVV